MGQGILFIEISIGLFFTILFLQSGIDKVIDFKGNKSYIQSVFKNSIFNPFSSLLFIIITVIEVAAGGFCLVGSISYLLTGSDYLLMVGLQLSVVSLLFLFIGQRIAKDYAGAASLVAYFITAILGLFIMSY